VWLTWLFDLQKSSVFMLLLSLGWPLERRGETCGEDVFQGWWRMKHINLPRLPYHHVVVKIRGAGRKLRCEECP